MKSTSTLIVPDVVLAESSCSTCLKYLTVSPIEVHPHGRHICGRCTKLPKDSSSPIVLKFHGHPPENQIPLTLLGYASSKNHSFPCINRFEGCLTYTSYSLIKKHEEGCCSETRKCFLCDFQGIGTQIVEHFRRDHQKNMVTTRSNFLVNLNKNMRNYYLYSTSKSLFVIRIRFRPNLKLFMLQIQYLNSFRKKENNLKCVIHFYSAVNNKCFTTLSTEPFTMSNNLVHMNFRLNDIKMLDFDFINFNLLLSEI